MAEETAQFGWCKLAELVGKSPRACMRRKAALREAGAISYTYRKNTAGVKYKAMFFFPSLVKAFLIQQSGRGETF